MIARLRFASVMVQVVLHILLALFIVGLLFPFWSMARRRWLVRWWSGHVLWIMGLRVKVVGPLADRTVFEQALRPGGIGTMFVMNHISWLDIYLVHSLRAARFVAKAEISRWPLLGFLTDRTGALFIERGKRHAVREVNHRIAQMLRAGDMIGVFPEGTTSDGARLLPFHANLIQPAIDVGVPILIAGLRYRERDGRPTTATSYTGDTSLLESIVRMARHGPLLAELHLIEAIDGRIATRHEVARKARALIAASLRFDDEADEALEDLSTVVVVPDDARAAASFSPGAALAGTAPGTPPDPRDELL